MLWRMPGRYDSTGRKLDLGGSSSFGSEPAKPRKKDPLEEFLRFGGALAPGIGTVGGALLGGAAGGLATGGAGVIPGAAMGAGVGAGAGMAAGGAMTYGADEMARPAEEEEAARVAREQERAARAKAALGIIGGL